MNGAASSATRISRAASAATRTSGSGGSSSNRHVEPAECLVPGEAKITPGTKGLAVEGEGVDWPASERGEAGPIWMLVCLLRSQDCGTLMRSSSAGVVVPAASPSPCSRGPPVQRAPKMWAAGRQSAKRIAAMTCGPDRGRLPRTTRMPSRSRDSPAAACRHCRQRCAASRRGDHRPAHRERPGSRTR